MDIKFKIGSSLILQNCRDNDYLVIAEKLPSKEEYLSNKQEGIEYHYYTKEMILDEIGFKKPFNRTTILPYLWSYQLDENIIKQGFPFKHSVIRSRNNYISLLNYLIDSHWFDRKRSPMLNNGNCSKIIYHIAYIVFILENNSTILTDEQKAIVQQIHDKQMPQSYLDTLQEKIKNLN